MSADELLKSIHDELEALVTGEDWLDLLKKSSKFRVYSFSNQLLIYMQRPDASRVMGYKQWPSVNRFVRKGEKGIAILAPLIYKQKNEPKGGESETFKKVIRGFRTVHVFDVSQTDGEPLAEPPQPVLLEGEAPEGLRQFIIGEIQQLGYVLRFPGTANWPDPDVRGWTHFGDKVVGIAPSLSPAQQAKTLAHELGHILMEHQGQGHRGIAEVEAESFSGVLCLNAGMNSLTYAIPYLAGWSGGDMKLVMKTATRVVDHANLVLGRYEAWLSTALQNAG